jgi:hypothetical protein
MVGSIPLLAFNVEFVGFSFVCLPLLYLFYLKDGTSLVMITKPYLFMMTCVACCVVSPLSWLFMKKVNAVDFVCEVRKFQGSD